MFYTKKIPRGAERNPLKSDGNITYDSKPVKRWPKSWTDSAKTLKISLELQQIITAWPKLPEHIKVAVKAIIEMFKANSK
ncbi:MAG: hypothetical protein KAI59_02480 [Planctomycetes bacterium]|nr:hypothetical protein [Planctomycetota bacterium]MCK5472872.1 hypothetical protein [Planctomycetota bacterium]